MGFSLLYWRTSCCYKKPDPQFKNQNTDFLQNKHGQDLKPTAKGSQWNLGTLLITYPPLLAWSITRIRPHPHFRGCQNFSSILTHLWEDLAGTANGIDSWLPSATEEQLNWTHTNASASPVYTSTAGCTFLLMYQAGITCKQSLELSGLPLYSPSNAYRVILFHTDHCSLTWGQKNVKKRRSLELPCCKVCGCNPTHGRLLK